MTANELERYVDLYKQSVCATAMCIVKNISDADDVTQEVFLRLYTYEGNFASDEHVKAWLLRCTVNRSRDILRSHWYKFSQPLSAAEKISHTDRTDDMLPLVMKLSRKSRFAMYLHYYEGYSVSEIAAMSGLSESAIKSRLARGREQLRRLLNNERIDDDEV